MVAQPIIEKWARTYRVCGAPKTAFATMTDQFTRKTARITTRSIHELEVAFQTFTSLLIRHSPTNFRWQHSRRNNLPRGRSYKNTRRNSSTNGASKTRRPNACSKQDSPRTQRRKRRRILRLRRNTKDSWPPRIGND